MEFDQSDGLDRTGFLLNLVAGDFGVQFWKGHRFSGTERTKYKEIVELLESFYEATLTVFAKERPKIFRVIPVSDELRDHIDSFAASLENWREMRYRKGF